MGEGEITIFSRRGCRSIEVVPQRVRVVRIELGALFVRDAGEPGRYLLMQN